MPLSNEAEIMFPARMGTRWGKNKSSKSTKKLASQCSKKQPLDRHGRGSSWAQDNHAAQIQHTLLDLLDNGNEKSCPPLAKKANPHQKRPTEHSSIKPPVARATACVCSGRLRKGRGRIQDDIMGEPCMMHVFVTCRTYTNAAPKTRNNDDGASH